MSTHSGRILAAATSPYRERHRRKDAGVSCADRACSELRADGSLFCAEHALEPASKQVAAAPSLVWLPPA